MFNKLPNTGLEDVHIIGYHCSYMHKGVHHALLEYADRGTLEDTMMKERNPSTNEEIESFWNNLLQVMEAIDRIHELDPDSEATPGSNQFEG